MVYIVYNPHANNGEGEKGVADVRAAFADRAPVLCDVTETDLRPFLTGLTAQDEVVLCGGDGTLNRLVNDLGGEPPAVPIRVWRFGTGNDFLRDVTERADPAAQTVLLNGYMKSLPYMEIEGRRHFFLNGCGGGIDALVCARMNDERGKKPSYAAVAVRSFFRDFMPMSVRVTVDGETASFDRVWMAGAMNGRYQGGGMLFGPEQDRSSDRLTFYLWHGTNRVGTLLHFPAIIKGTHGKYKKYCELRFCREITVEFSAPQYVQLDGETLSGVTRFTIRKQ